MASSNGSLPTQGAVSDSGSASEVTLWAGLAPGPQVMGILNVTPDSFSDGGVHFDTGRAIEAGLLMQAAGAGILDVGGESTRPGATPVSPEEEQTRVLPVIKALAAAGAVVSVDSRNAGTMAAALDAGAAIVNDVSGLAHDPAAASLLARQHCAVILMHMRGTPQTMMGLADYADVGFDVGRELQAMVDRAERAGIARSRIAVDPGVGFAKTGEQNVALLRRLPELHALGCPVVVGVSRKRFIGTLSGAESPGTRDAGSVAAALFALSRGASILRVHDVAGTVQAVRVWQALAG